MRFDYLFTEHSVGKSRGKRIFLFFLLNVDWKSTRIYFDKVLNIRHLIDESFEGLLNFLFMRRCFKLTFVFKIETIIEKYLNIIRDMYTKN